MHAFPPSGCRIPLHSLFLSAFDQQHRKTCSTFTTAKASSEKELERPYSMAIKFKFQQLRKRKKPGCWSHRETDQDNRNPQGHPPCWSNHDADQGNWGPPPTRGIQSISVLVSQQNTEIIHRQIIDK